MKLGDAMKPAAKEWKKMKKNGGSGSGDDGNLDLDFTPNPIDDSEKRAEGAQNLIDFSETAQAADKLVDMKNTDHEVDAAETLVEMQKRPNDEVDAANTLVAMKKPREYGGKSRKTKQNKLRKTKKNLLKKKSLKK